MMDQDDDFLVWIKIYRCNRDFSYFRSEAPYTYHLTLFTTLACLETIDKLQSGRSPRSGKINRIGKKREQDQVLHFMKILMVCYITYLQK